MLPELSLVIAAYNSEGEIERTLHRVHGYFTQSSYGYEVIVVDDGSTDKTGALVQAFGSQHPALRLLSNGHNRGKGHSVRKGMLEAKGRFIFHTDADLAYPIEGIEAFLQPLRAKAYDISVGSRVHPRSIFHLHPRHFRYVYRRHLMSRFFNRLVRRLLGIRVQDTQCGFKGFTQEAAKSIFPCVSVSGFAFDVEVLLIAQWLGYRILEVPVTYVYRGEVSTATLLRTIGRTFIDLMRIYLSDRRGSYRP